MAVEIMEGYVQISERGLSKVQRTIFGLGNSFKSVLSGPIAAFSMGLEGLGKIGLAGLGIGSLQTMIGALNPAPLLKEAAAAEALEVSMTAMLRSADKAKALIADLNQFANVTPFDNKEVNQTGRALLAFGVGLDQVIPTLNTLGDVAAGSGQPLDELANIFGQVKASGRLMTQEVLQMTNRSIPIIETLAKQFGVPETAIRGMVERGEVSFGDFQQALVNMTTGVGIFAQQMEKRSKTVEGMWSTIVGQSSLVKKEVGKVLTEAWQLPQRMTEIISSLDAIIPNIPQMMTPLMPALSAIGDAVWGAFQWFQTSGPDVIRFLQSLKPTFDSVAEAIQNVFGYVIDYASGAINLFRSAVQGLSDSGLFGNLESAATTTFQSISFLIDMAKRQMELMRPYTDAWMQVFYKGGQLIGTVFGNAWKSIQGIGEVLAFMGNQLDGKILPSMSSINAAFIEFGTIAVQSIGTAIDNVRFFFDNVDVMVPMGIEKMKIFASNVPELIRVAFVNGYRWAEWFFSNFTDIMGTLGDFAMTTFLNLKNNLVSLFSALWKWVQSGFSGEFEFDWTPLTDGFQSQIKAWPKLLEAQLNEASPELDGLRKQLDERRLEWEKKEKESSNKNSFAKSPIAEMTGAITSYSPRPMAIDDSPGSGRARKKSSIETASGDLSAKRFGSAEAFSAVLSNMNRKADTTEKTMLKVQQAQLEQMKKTNDHLSAGTGNRVEIVAGIA